jgi:Protein of unknown function (DUF5132)
MHSAVSDAQEDLDAVENEDTDEKLSAEEIDMVATVATVGVVAIGAALIEAELLAGLALGVAAVAAPKLVPKLGSALAPMFKSTVRGVYKFGQKAKELVAETNEHVQDIVAEVDAEAKGKDAAVRDTLPSA